MSRLGRQASYLLMSEESHVKVASHLHFLSKDVSSSVPPVQRFRHRNSARPDSRFVCHLMTRYYSWALTLSTVDICPASLDRKYVRFHKVPLHVSYSGTAPQRSTSTLKVLYNLKPRSISVGSKTTLAFDSCINSPYSLGCSYR